MWYDSKSPTISCTYPPVHRAPRLHLRSTRHNPTPCTVASGQPHACPSTVPCTPVRPPRAPYDLAPSGIPHSQHCSSRTTKLHLKDPNRSLIKNNNLESAVVRLSLADNLPSNLKESCHPPSVRAGKHSSMPTCSRIP
ncbi:hypothetical protein KFK09_023205 [Dendrobium nobile]|uniref:Uncharacterized protein n=1 Tax=Dendrobium nobile TaxID=94219 RepID=A0A8T3ALQ0_DENNO|nr:hypothetical protein KFK09_023205 [Dendrobium nobile]